MTQMDDKVKAMVEAIARETIERLTGKQTTGHSCLVLVPAYVTYLSVVQPYIGNKAQNCDLTVVHSGQCSPTVFPAGTVYFDTNDSAVKDTVAASLHSFDEIISLQPPLSLLEKVLSADDSDFHSFLLIQAALHRIPVSILAGFSHIEGKKGAFFEKVRTLIAGMTDMGFHINYPETSMAPSETTQSDSTLITEEDIMIQYRNGSQIINADKRTIVTPLARDKIRELGIVLEQT